tara:strand:- start:2028 stop:2207 length:180 start_codon:yes stop_codon:yes gene_type:complete
MGLYFYRIKPKEPLEEKTSLGSSVTRREQSALTELTTQMEDIPPYVGSLTPLLEEYLGI